MQVKIIGLAAILCCLPVTPQAHMVIITTQNGLKARVAAQHAHAFQSFISALEARGYRIHTLGGWRSHGSCAQCDKHPLGEAIDVNQRKRNDVSSPFPYGVSALARAHGLFHGALWCHADTGHFEVNPRALACQSKR